MQTNCMLYYIGKSVPIMSSESVILFYLALENNCSILGSIQNTNILENIQWKATKMIRAKFVQPQAGQAEAGLRCCLQLPNEDHRKNKAGLS